MAFFSRDYFGEMTTVANEHILAQFTLALEIEFERILQFHNEGYGSGHDYDLPKLLIRSNHTYSVSSAAEASFNPHRLSRINNTHLSINPETKTSGVTTSSSTPQMTNF